ncbi:MAG: hypothetical protein P4L90_26070 [Rhodopila sp.]|nr:hypothetical protein [Rhodopila sp.]
MADMVVVGCKAPNGLILNLDRYVAVGKEENGNVRREAGKGKVTLKGWARPWGAPDTTEGGYALTAIPKDFWDEWYKLNATSDLVVNKVILGPHRDSISQARDHAAVEQMFRPARITDVPNVAPDKAG